MSGRVINGISGVPVPRALVRLNQRAVLSDGLGHFEFQQVTDQSPALLVTKPGFYASVDAADSGYSPVPVDITGTSTTLQLYPEAIITGIVSTRTGEPLSRVRLSLTRMNYDESGPHLVPTGFAATNSRGEFRFATQPGAFRVSLNYSPAGRDRSEAVLPLVFPEQTSSNEIATFQVGSSETRHLDLHPKTSIAYPIRLHIDGSFGQRPQITVRMLSGLEFTVAAREDRSIDSEARVLQIDLPAGSYHLHATTSSPQQATEAEANITVTGQAADSTILQFETVPSLLIQIQVDTSTVEADPSLSPGASNTPPNLYDFAPSLRRVGGDEPSAPGVHIDTRPDKSLAVSAPAGVYRLVLHNRGQWYVKSAFYGTTDLLNHDLVVGPGVGGEPIRLLVSASTGKLAGIVRVDGASAKAWVYLIANGPSAVPVIILHTQSDGRFVQNYMPPGSYTALASRQRMSIDLTNPEIRAGFGARAATVQVIAGAEATVDLDAAPGLGQRP